MGLDVLISCMDQKDASLIESSNIQSDVVVINQCGYDSYNLFYFLDKRGLQHKAKFISVNELGLSKSRNRAIQNSENQFCLLCDDDETLVDNAKDFVLKAFEDNPQVDVLTFALDYNKKNYPKEKVSIRKFGILKINSPQIAFRRKSIIEKGIFFDELMGSGTGNGGGEENKFLMDCFKSGLNIIYLPIVIAKINNTNSSRWNVGFNEQYFLNRGWSTRRILGVEISLLYAFYFSVKKYKLYRDKLSFFSTLKLQVKGIFQKR